MGVVQKGSCRVGGCTRWKMSTRVVVQKRVFGIGVVQKKSCINGVAPSTVLSSKVLSVLCSTLLCSVAQYSVVL